MSAVRPKFKIRHIVGTVYFVTAMAALCALLINYSYEIMRSIGAANFGLQVGSIIATCVTGQLAIVHIAYINRYHALIRNYLAICLANSALCLLVLFNIGHGGFIVSPIVAHAIWAFCHSLMLFCMLNCFSVYFQLPPGWRTFVPWAFTLVAVGLGTALYLKSPQATAFALSAQYALIREVTLVVALATLFFAGGMFRPFKLSEKFFASLHQRFMLSEHGEIHKTAALIDFNASLVMSIVGLMLIVQFPASTMGIASLSSISIVYSLLSQLYKQHQELNFRGNIFTRNAAAFHDKYLAATGMKSAVVGNKTATFVIDHDPFHRFTKELPASLVQIRNEEVMKCVDLVLGDKQVHGQFINNQIYGAINPESSERPCVDALMTFACLFLDASPLIERKLASLFEILPIVDPELYSMVGEAEAFKRLFVKNDWFYYFNYRWVDQWIAVQGDKAQYRVNLNTLPIADFIQIHRQLNDEAADTQHIIIGEEARERLMFEAPAIGERLKPYPIHVEDREIIVFVMEVESLIVLLDQFFDLNSARLRLRDYPPREENMKVLEICEQQIRLMNRMADIKNLVTSVMNHPWQGFVEKGRVLKIISAASGRAKDVLNDGKLLPADLSALLLEAVQKVGYPSQLLHSAQMQKLALRDRRQILQVAGNPSHVRFIEAWVYLSNIQPHTYPEDAIQEIVNFLLSIPGKPLLATNPVVQFKGIDCIVNLAKDGLILDGSTVERLLATSILWAVSSRFSPRGCSLLLDGMMYLVQARQGTFRVPDHELGYFQAYLAEFKNMRVPAGEIDRLQARYKKLMERLTRNYGYAA